MRIEQGDEIKGRISFQLDQGRQHWARNNPREEERFRALSRGGGKFSLLINPDRRLVPELAKAGWITSAYLLAFYTFGYRYVWHSIVDTRVRSYIVRSLHEDPPFLQLDDASDLAVFEIADGPAPDPQIGIVVPSSDCVNIHLRVRFLRYEVRLPFLFVPRVLGSLLFAKMPDFHEQLASVADQDGYLYVPIECTSLDGHDCVWGYVLGKPVG